MKSSYFLLSFYECIKFNLLDIMFGLIFLINFYGEAIELGYLSVHILEPTETC